MLYCCLLLLFLQFHCILSNSTVCLKPVDPGPCKRYQIRYYWDEQRRECKQFYYGGCMGNENKFPNRDQCQRTCVHQSHFQPTAIYIPELCFLPLLKGHCGDNRGGYWWWYFDSKTGTCQQFHFYGCYGNANRFPSLLDCQKTCAEHLAPIHECTRCDGNVAFCRASTRKCECRMGFTMNKKGACEDFDECAADHRICDTNAWCMNTHGSYKCTCVSGYLMDDGKCKYVGQGKVTKSCELCHKHAICGNGLWCQCNMGYVGDGFDCKDVNECEAEPFPCDSHAECINTPGSFMCKCWPKFAGNGYTCTQTSLACMEKFDLAHEEKCAADTWQQRYLFDHVKGKCVDFWYGGCNGTSNNIFPDKDTCGFMCEQTRANLRAEVCWNIFDPHYEQQCSDGLWMPHYYFDHRSLKCTVFWYDKCKGPSRNIFSDLLTCEWLCQLKPNNKPKACLEPFDAAYQSQCTKNGWRIFYFYNVERNACMSFWYGNCKGTAANVFSDLPSCQATCVETTVRRHAGHWVGGTPPVPFAPACVNEPCYNGGTCKPISKDKYRCDCVFGYTGSDCSIPPDNACMHNLCMNDGACKVMTDPTTKFICDCLEGYVGDRCESQPCASNPCLNGGKCKTTKGWSGYWCECPERFAGNRCHLEIMTKASSTTSTTTTTTTTALTTTFDIKEMLEKLKTTTQESIEITEAVDLSTDSAEIEASKNVSDTDLKLEMTENGDDYYSSGGEDQNGDLSNFESDNEPVAEPQIHPSQGSPASFGHCLAAFTFAFALLLIS